MDYDPQQNDRQVLILRILFLIFSSAFGWLTYNQNEKLKTAQREINNVKQTISAGFSSMPSTQGKTHETTTKTKQTTFKINLP